MTPKQVELKSIGQERIDGECWFCQKSASHWMQRVYSFGVNVDRVCDSCGQSWKSKVEG